jgi:hypothetical protein
MTEMVSTEQVLERIKQERNYQDHKWGTIQEHPHELLAWFAILQIELDHLKDALETGANEKPNATTEFLHIAAVAVAALEQWGLPVGR